MTELDQYKAHVAMLQSEIAKLQAERDALKVARDALRYYGGDKYGTFANEAYAKINKVLKP